MADTQVMEEEISLPHKETPPIIPIDFNLDGGHNDSHGRKNSIMSLSPTLKERRRQTLKYFAQTQDLNKEEIMDFLQNEIRRKTPMDKSHANTDDDDDYSDCKDDFDSDVDENDHELDDNNIKDRDSENEEELMINNGEEPSWKELLLDDSTRQQFEELAREYVGNIAEDKRKLQNEHYQLQQKYLKLQESNKV